MSGLFVYSVFSQAFFVQSNKRNKLELTWNQVHFFRIFKIQLLANDMNLTKLLSQELTLEFTLNHPESNG